MDGMLTNKILRGLVNPADHERTFGLLRGLAKKLIYLTGPDPDLQAIVDGGGALEPFSRMAKTLLVLRGETP